MQDETDVRKDTCRVDVSVLRGGSSCSMEEDTMNPVGYEAVQIEKTEKVCPLCEDYAKGQAAKPVVGCLAKEDA